MGLEEKTRRAQLHARLDELFEALDEQWSYQVNRIGDELRLTLRGRIDPQARVPLRMGLEREGDDAPAPAEPAPSALAAIGDDEGDPPAALERARELLAHREAELRPVIAEAADPAALEALVGVEESAEKPRKGVLTLLRARLAQLTAAAGDTEAAQQGEGG